MITLIAGRVGYGKTLFLILQALLTNRKIVANFDIYGKDIEVYSFYKYLSTGYDNCVIMIDEIYSLFDSRNSMSKMNILASYPLFQSRKTTVDIYATLQLKSTVDLRYREMVDRYIEALGIIQSKGLYYYKYRIHEIKGNKYVKSVSYLPVLIARKLYQYYNTHQIIDIYQKEKILEAFKTPQEKILDVSKVANLIVDKYYPYEDITHDMVISFLFKNPELGTFKENIVYVECKQIVKERNKLKAEKL